MITCYYTHYWYITQYCMIPELVYELSKSVTYIIVDSNIRAIRQHLCINIVELVFSRVTIISIFF